MSAPAPVSLAEVHALARQAGATTVEPTVELAPSGTIRTFRVGEVCVRFDVSQSDGLATARLAMQTLATAVIDPPVAPVVDTFGDAELGGVRRPWLAYAWLDGATMRAHEMKAHLDDVGRAVARLHGARVFDLHQRMSRAHPMSLMDAFKATSDRLRAWILAREADGLAQDMLTLTLSDVSRALRAYVMSQDHHFRTARRRVLLHGALAPETLVRLHAGGPQAIRVVNLERACLGDAADDVASLVLAARLDVGEEEKLLGSYLDELERLGRPDRRFLVRYFPRKYLRLLAAPVELLEEMRHIKEGSAPVINDRVAEIEARSAHAYELLARAFAGLRGLSASARAVTADDVRVMGRLMVHEELLLAGRTFRIAITGLPYAGKTEVGSALARRLSHAYLSTTVLGRALVLADERRKQAESEQDAAPGDGSGTDELPDTDEQPDTDPALQRAAQGKSAKGKSAKGKIAKGKSAKAKTAKRQADAATGASAPAADRPAAVDGDDASARVRALFDAGFRLESIASQPYYAAYFHDENVTEQLRREDIRLGGATVLDDEPTRVAFAAEVARRFAPDGVVIEGAYAQELVPGRARHFHLTSDGGVRRARLMAHRADLEDEDEAEALLDQLDQGAPAAHVDAETIDLASSPPGTAALEILWRLLPVGRRPGQVGPEREEK